MALSELYRRATLKPEGQRCVEQRPNGTMEKSTKDSQKFGLGKGVLLCPHRTAKPRPSQRVRGAGAAASVRSPCRGQPARHEARVVSKVKTLRRHVGAIQQSHNVVLQMRR